MLVFDQPNIKKKEILEVVDTLKSGWLKKKLRVDKFEKLIEISENDSKLKQNYIITSREIINQ